MKIPIKNKSRKSKVPVRVIHSEEMSEVYNTQEEYFTFTQLAKQLAQLSPSDQRRVQVAAKHLRKFMILTGSDLEEDWKEN